MKINFRHFLSVVMLGVATSVAAAGGVVVPSSDLFYINNNICGVVRGELLAGEILSNGRFLTYKKKISNLRSQIANASGKKLKRLQRNLKTARNKLAQTKPICVALSNNSAIPGSTLLSYSDGFDTLNITSVGTRLVGYCPSGLTSDVVWGTNIYTHDSAICTAAVHAGLITFEQGGNIVAEFRAGLDNYVGTTSNGITTYDYGTWPGSYVFINFHTNTDHSI
jgi:LCCL domain